MGLNVLVAGGAGYVGAHVCKALARAGHHPVVLDSLAHGHREAVRWGPLVEADIADRAAVGRAIGSHRIDAVMHFAAWIFVGESMTSPLKYFANNLGGSLALLDAAMAAGVRRVVFSSTAAVYGEPRQVPIPESHPTEPINPYGESKLMVERVLRWLDRQQGLRFAALRYFNASGADPDAEIGERHDPETHLVPLAILAALGKAPALNIFGDDYDTPDGTAIRDYIHVADLAGAHVAALEHLAAGGASLTLNLGGGSGTSVREIVDAVARVGGRPVPASFAPRRPGDPPRLVADIAAARAALAWSPRHSDIDTIVRTAWAWHTRG
ncbi:MAG: UDP-glucose 4-epimerase GalE [Phreatobacter sp.]|uniref:UDP-glucose 4-epimerase GalE n=1 Tax=Phreatobacter sp. TaxID=1966341 RepID=UPI001A5CC48C|nr:UDP-glucose 4-epimerase GalE [Phreatobacter sp.]MBL8571874.1 UDP-glucose 4-epimerase GalE [Phreatobacter sp.]